MGIKTKDELPERRVWAPYFSLLYAGLSKAVEEVGWCLSVHGSMTRDLDLVAIPWREDAVPEDELVLTIVQEADAYLDKRSPIERPQGRRVYIIRLTPHYYIDLSVRLPPGS